MKTAFPLTFAGLLTTTLPVFADELAGTGKAHLCTGCHGADGMKAPPGAQPIGGRPAESLIASIEDYRQLRRINPAMQMLLLPMSDEDVAEVADYFELVGTDTAR